MAKKFDSKGAARGMARERTLTILVPIISVLLALVVGGIVIACLGKNPIQGYALLFSGSLGTPQKFASSLVSACPLIFTALAAAFAYRCGVFNLGGEGQFIMGAVSAIVFLLVTGIEGIAGTVLAILVGTVVGALWAALPGIMKITRGLNEMITSIMLNYVATLFMGFIYTNAFRDGGNPQTPSVADSVMLAKIPGFRIHTGVILAIVLGLVVAYVISKTSFGFKIGAVGLNPLASKVNGFNVKFLVVAAFVISGAIAGMGGAVELLGKQYRLMSGFGSGFGFDGVANRAHRPAEPACLPARRHLLRRPDHRRLLHAGWHHGPHRHRRDHPRPHHHLLRCRRGPHQASQDPGAHPADGLWQG